MARVISDKGTIELTVPLRTMPPDVYISLCKWSLHMELSLSDRDNLYAWFNHITYKECHPYYAH